MLTKNKTPMSATTFVSAIGWIFAIVSGFGFVLGLIQTLLLEFVFDVEAAKQTMRTSPEGMPLLAEWVLHYMPVMALVLLVYSAFVFVSSIGLLKRMGWARRMFITILFISIAAVFCGPVLNFWLASLPEQIGPVPGAREFSLLMAYSGMINLLIALALGVAFGWIIKRLMSPEVAAQFRR